MELLSALHAGALRVAGALRTRAAAAALPLPDVDFMEGDASEAGPWLEVRAPCPAHRSHRRRRARRRGVRDSALHLAASRGGAP